MTSATMDPNTTPAGGVLDVTNETEAEQTVARGDHDPNRRSGPSPTCETAKLLQSLTGPLGVLDERLQAVDQRLVAMNTDLGQLGTESRVLSEMHDQCRTLQERFHEREVLLPIFRALIGIADRCRNEAAKMRATLNNQERGLELDVVLALRHLLDAREADRIELEALLATLGVEVYQHGGDLFQAGLQKCVKRIRTSRPERHERVAVRLLPGYRRDETIVRPECVGVYVQAT